MIVKPRVRGFICVTAHPVGCEANVKEQIDFIKARGPIAVSYTHLTLPTIYSV